MASQDSWEIDPEAVEKVLKATNDAGEDLTEAMSRSTLETPISNAVAGAAGSVPVADALAAFIENRQRALADMVDRVTAGVAGAATATSWYLQGDEEMAATQQANLSKAISSGDLSTFTTPK